MISRLLYGTALSLFVTLPTSFVLAQSAVGRLVPEGDAATFGWCEFIKLVQNLINFAIFLGIMATALLFMWAGFLYITNGGSSENISKAKKIFKAVVWGFVAILGGWLLVDTLMKSLTGGKFGFWNKFDCVAQQARPLEDTTADIFGGGTNGGRYSDIGGGGNSTPIISERGSAGNFYDPSNHDGQDIRSYLSDNEISFARGSCSGDTEVDCIDMSKLREYPTQQLVRIADACPNCALTITRGGEFVDRQRGLYTHVNGYSVDVAANQSLDAYFTQRLQKQNGTEDEYMDACDNIYNRLREPNQVWRLTIWNTCSLD